MEQATITTVYPLFYEFGFSKEELYEETRIEEDLGITGTDAINFIVQFSKLTKVDVSEFKAADYFWPESSSLYKLSGWSKPNKKKILKVKHLLAAIQKGKLDEAVINLCP